MNNHYSLHVCGARGSRTVSGRNFLEFGGATSCFIMKQGSHAVLIDCGSGLYDAKEILKDCTKIDVLFTHLHYDHILGLLDWGVFRRDAIVTFYGYFESWEFHSFEQLCQPPYWPVSRNLGRCVNVEEEAEIKLNDRVNAQFRPSGHPNFGGLIRVNVDDVSVCFAFDYEHTYPFPRELAEGCQIIFYDGMYQDDDYEAHRGWGHSTWQKGGALGEEMSIPHLYITHHDPDSTDEMLRQREKTARERYRNISFARAGDTLILGREYL